MCAHANHSPRSYPQSNIRRRKKGILFCGHTNFTNSIREFLMRDTMVYAYHGVKGLVNNSSKQQIDNIKRNIIATYSHIQLRSHANSHKLIKWQSVNFIEEKRFSMVAIATMPSIKLRPSICQKFDKLPNANDLR